MPTLAKTDVAPMLKQRVIRLETDVLMLRSLTSAEIRGIYDHLETARDELSRLLDRANGKHV
jgi:hypothetical protein